mmetsp:Transcript_33591/g.36177  ORF Transcript_33591/g.36177 Transcript_33591/m.36177 type:complete len:109 (-) Transcript_33591:96-422(-)
MNYIDRCRHVCHHECTDEADFASNFDDTLLHCSKKCKNKGDKYCDEELQNEKQKTDLLATDKNINKSTLTSGPGRRHGGIGVSCCSADKDFSLSQDSTTTGGRDDNDK